MAHCNLWISLNYIFMQVSRPVRSCLWSLLIKEVLLFNPFRLIGVYATYTGVYAVFSAELPSNWHTNGKASPTKLTKKTPNPLVYIALRHKKRSEPMLFHKHINDVQILQCPQECLSTSTPFIQIQHLKWSSLLCGGLSSHTVIDLSSTNPCGQTHLRGNRGVKKQEVSRDTDTEKIETDVQD